MNRKLEESFQKALAATRKSSTTSNYQSALKRLHGANTVESLRKLEKSFTRIYEAGQFSPNELAKLDRLIMEKIARIETGVHGVSKKKILGEHDPEILEGMARGPYADIWAQKQEERGHSFSGRDIYEEAPRTPSFAKKWAKELREKILNLNTAPSLTYLYEIAKSRGYKNNPETFGFHLGMQSVGHGVGWQDDADYRLAKRDDIRLPHTEFYY